MQVWEKHVFPLEGLRTRIRPPVDEMTKKVLILTGDIGGNLGDNAIAWSTCENLTAAAPGVSFTLVSDTDSFGWDLKNVTVIPKGIKGLFQLVRKAVESDVVLCGGGGLFQDDDSRIKMPYWALRLEFVRLFCGKIVGYSLGVGPLRRPSSRLFARMSFACMERVSVRDPEAMKTARATTGKRISIVPDPALILGNGSRPQARSILETNGVPMDGTPLIGVAARKWFHHVDSFIPHMYAAKYHLRKIPGREKCQAFSRLLARALDRMATEHGAFIVFMPSYNSSHEADDQMCRETMENMVSGDKRLLCVDTPKMYKAVAGHLDVMLGARMHPAILAASEGIGIVGISYNQKFKGFFQMLGIQDRLIDVRDFVDREMVDELVSLLVTSLKEEPPYLNRMNQMRREIHEFNRSIVQEYIK